MTRGFTVSREADIRASLASLGETADEMAASLRAAGITGIRENGEACPLAVYLRREGFRDLNVTRAQIEDARARFGVEGRWRMDTPPPAEEFIGRFDDYKDWPDLADEDDGS